MVDIHTHFLRAPGRTSRALWHAGLPWMRHGGADRTMLMSVTRNFARSLRRAGNPLVRLEAMDRDGVDVQIMCVTPVLFSYQRPPAQGLECARLFNDARARSARTLRGG